MTQWNEERQQRIEEKVYLNRLHSDVIEGKNIFQLDFIHDERHGITFKRDFRCVQREQFNLYTQ